MFKNIRQRIEFSALKSSLALINPSDKKRLLPYFWAQIFLSILDLIGVILIGFIGSLAINGISNRTSSGRTKQLLELLNLDSLIFQQQVAIMGLIAGSILVLKTFISMKIVQKSLITLSLIGFNISKRLIKEFFSNPNNVVEAQNSQRLVHSLTNGAVQITLGVTSALMILLADFLLLGILFFALLIVNALTTFTIFFFYATVALLLFKNTHKRASRAGAVEVKGNLEASFKLIEGVAAYRELFLRGSISSVEDEVLSLRRSISQSQAELAFLPNVSKYAIEGSLVVGAILVCGIQFLFSDAYHAIANLTLFLAAASRIAPAVLRIQNSVVQIKTSLTSIAPTLELSEAISRFNDSQKTLNSSKEDKFMGAIKFQNVTYAHDSNSEVILNNVSFEIQPGEFIGIIGVSGAGKSTLLDLITGIKKPNTGTITIDLKDPRQVVNEFPGSIAFVSQNTFIKDASLEDNVRFNANFEDIDSRNFKKVLKETNLEKLYLSVRDKSSLGESGKNLSGGEKQRIGIARGLYTHPKLMLLDEPTSALDSENEALVSESITALKGKATVLFISHDYRVLEKADRILRIHDGKLEILTDDERNSLT